MRTGRNPYGFKASFIQFPIESKKMALIIAGKWLARRQSGQVESQTIGQQLHPSDIIAQGRIINADCKLFLLQREIAYGMRIRPLACLKKQGNSIFKFLIIKALRKCYR